MLIYTRGTAIIRHGETGQEFEIDEGEIQWEPVGGDERSMGPETIYQALIDHEELGELRWTLSEYPVGAEGLQTTDVGKHELIEDFEIGLTHEPECDEIEDFSTLRNRMKDNPDWVSALTKTTIATHLVEWFRQFYEDPANETPYNSREGGYLYAHGGPYSAEEELRENFEDIVSEEAIMQAVDIVQKDGLFDWAPGNRHPAKIAFYEEAIAEQYQPEDFEIEELHVIASDNVATGLGSENELTVRKEVLSQIAALKADMPKPVSHGGMGHNHPPEEFELVGEKLAATTKSLDAIEVELTSDLPNAEVVAEKASFLKKAAEWVAQKLDKTVDEFCKGFGSSLGKTAGVALPAVIITSPYWGKIAALLGILKDWLLLALGI